MRLNEIRCRVVGKEEKRLLKEDIDNSLTCTLIAISDDAVFHIFTKAND